MDAKPRGKASLRDEVYESVRARVLAMVGQIDAPVRVREEELARELGVSRTPIREAFLRLGEEGILNIQPRRGALLMPVSRKEYLEWLKLREELEAFAAKEAALNASQRDVDALRAIFAPFTEANLDERVAEYAAANVAFHKAVIKLAANSLLEKVWKSFGHKQMLRTKTIERLNRARGSLREHHALIDAIEARDATLAADLARQHVHGLLDQTLAVHTDQSTEV